MDLGVIMAIGLVFFAISLSSPSVTYHVSPAEKAAYYTQGMPVLERSGQGVRVTVRHQDQTMRREYVVDVSIENQSSSNLLISPMDFYLQGTSSAKRVTPVNPELEIQELDKRIDKLDKRASTSRTLYLTGSVIGFADDMAKIGKRTSEERKQDAQDDKEQSDEYHQAKDRYDRDRLALLKEKQEWENMFRTTTIVPRSSYKGRLHFKVPKKMMSSKSFQLKSSARALSFVGFEYRLTSVK